MNIKSVIKKFKEISIELKNVYGYKESYKEPYLYYYTYNLITFFVDMRIKKWKRIDPVFFWNWINESINKIIRQRAVLFEWNRLCNLTLKLDTRDKEEDVGLIPDYYKFHVDLSEDITYENIPDTF
jgi:hypothetical protein